MTFNIISIFPEFFDSALRCGLLGKALEQGVFRVRLVTPRDFALDAHRSVDDRPFGGGPGMVMTLGPLTAALRSLDAPGKMLLLCPGGRALDHHMAARLSQEETVTLICGRYEGIDARLELLFQTTPVSVGNVVLNGGETAALCVLEAVARLLPGFMGHEESSRQESFVQGLLDHPHYTRPEVFEGRRVPEVLLSGDHARIAAWRREASLAETLAHRPELLDQASLSTTDVRVLQQLHGRSRRVGKNLFLALVHAPVLDKYGHTGAASLTNLDIHDIGRVSRTYGASGYFVCTPLQDQRRLARHLLAHWTAGRGLRSNPDRASALEQVHIVDSLDSAVRQVHEQTGSAPLLVGTSANAAATLSYARLRQSLEDRPVILALGTGHGLAPEVLEGCAGVLPPIRFFSGYNHLSVRAAAAVIVDRLLGDAG